MKNGWEREPEINFGVEGEAKWVGVTFTHDLSWRTHCNQRMDLAGAGISRLGSSLGGLSPTTWKLGASELLPRTGGSSGILERLRKLQYKAVRKVTRVYDGARQTTLENIHPLQDGQG